MLGIPLTPVPSQTVNVTLNGQVCTINVYHKFYGLFLDLLVSGQVVVQGVICQNQNFIVRSFYLGFVGDLMFFDTQGKSDPDFLGLGDVTTARFVLVYLFPSELPEDYGLNPYDPDFLTDPDEFMAAFPSANIGAAAKTG